MKGWGSFLNAQIARVEEKAETTEVGRDRLSGGAATG
jgi:hypothetical protein